MLFHSQFITLINCYIYEEICIPNIPQNLKSMVLFWIYLSAYLLI